MDDYIANHHAYLQRDLIARMGRYPVRAALRSGAMRRVWERVLVESAHETDLRTRCSAALLLHGPGTVVAGPTAARLHGHTAIDSPVVHVLVPYGHPARNRPGLAVHNGPLPPADVTEVEGLPLLTPERVAADLLCTARPRDAIAVVDQILGAEPAERREELRARLSRRLEKRADPRGTRRGLRLLGLATGRAESPPESWLLLEIADLGFPPAEVNWSLYSPNGVELYRLDLAWPEPRIGLEYNGYAVHAEREDEDLRRAEDLRRRGWIIIPVTVDDVQDNRRLERVLREAFESRGLLVSRR
jgi:hypothetical protein